MWRDWLKGLNAGNAKSKHLKDAQSAKQSGTAQESAKFLIGHLISKNATRDQNN